MRRATPIPQQDLGCATNRANYATMEDYERYAKGMFNGYLQTIGGYTGAQIQTLKNSNETAKTNLYNTALAALQFAENTANSYIRCINKDIIQRNDYSSRLYTLQNDVEDLRKEAAAKKEIVNEAKERSSQLQKPYNNTSWYESWFPLGRPIQKENVPVLLSISILMLVFSLGIFLRFAGKELRFESINSANSFVKNLNSKSWMKA